MNRKKPLVMRIEEKRRSMVKTNLLSDRERSGTGNNEGVDEDEAKSFMQQGPETSPVKKIRG